MTDIPPPPGTGPQGAPEPSPANSPQTPAASPAGPPKEGNVVGLIAFIASLVGFVFACIPGALIVGWVLLPVAFILAIVGLVLPNRKRVFALVGLIVSVVGTIVGIVVFVAVVASSVSSAFGRTSNPVESASPSSSASSTPSSSSSFKDGILTTPELKIEITEHKVIQVGQPGNEYGSKPVIAFYYSTTNLTDKRVEPDTAFILNITAYQDNNPNAENKLNVGSLPDEKFLDSQTEDIKKGGTVPNAIAFELDDLTTPIDLVASNDLGITKLGTVRYTLQ